MKTWFINFDDTDFAYVLAETRDDALRIAVADWATLWGFRPNDLEYRERLDDPVEVREEPRIPASSFGPGLLVHYGLARWACAVCDHMIVSGEASAWKGTYGFCERCRHDDRFSLFDGPPVGRSILLSTEF